MKKIILILNLIVFIQLQVMALEDCIIYSENPVKSVYSEDENILEIIPLYNIDNTKNTMILRPKSIGKTLIILETTDGEAFIDAEITENKTILPELENLKYFVLDKPDIQNINTKNNEDVREKPVLRGME